MIVRESVDMEDIKSSYKKNNYDKIFQSICFSLNPKKIVEFGILEGYSLDSFVRYGKNSLIEANDLFDDFPYNSANYNFIKNKFIKNTNVSIHKRDFYQSANVYEDNSIDILHVDIANTGDVFEFAIQNYLPKVRGLMILEGGSIERDNVEWMIKYNKPKIHPVLKKYSNDVRIAVMEDFPSITLIRK
jgi:hypothetical protein